MCSSARYTDNASISTDTFICSIVWSNELFMSQKTKKKRQQRAQSRLALARFRQQQREQRQRTAAHRAEKQWNKTLRHLADLGATVKQHEELVGDKEKTIYEVTW